MPKWGMPGLPEFTCSHWKTVFPHEDKSQGHPTSVDAASLHKVKGRGKRQAWNFRVKYAMGDTKDIIKQSDGIPLGVSRAAALRLIESGFKVQTVTEASIAELRIVRSTISQLLETYGSESDHDAWDQFFDQRIPTSIDDPMLSVSRRDTWLHQLYSKCGGEIRRKEYVDIDDKIPLSHFADSLVFPQGVLTKKSRDQVITYCKERVSIVLCLILKCYQPTFYTMLRLRMFAFLKASRVARIRRGDLLSKQLQAGQPWNLHQQQGKKEVDPALRGQVSNHCHQVKVCRLAAIRENLRKED